jgi:hypothetical protein
MNPSEPIDQAFLARKPIKDFEGRYSVTEDGRVWSEDRVTFSKKGVGIARKGQWLKPFDLGDSYLRVNLRMAGSLRMFCIHWLVARTFLIDPKNGMEIDHIDRNCQNNHVSNLRYVTKTKNALNREAKGCYYVPRKKKWQARLGLRGKKIQIGYFNTEEEARAAYVKTKEALLLTLT